MFDSKVLPHAYPRRWLDAFFDAGDGPSVAARYQALLSRALDTPEALLKFLDDWCELNDAVSEAGSLRYVAMTCATDDPEREKAYLGFLSEVEEPSKEPNFKLEQKYLQSPHRAALGAAEYRLFDRSVAVHVELFREINVPLETEESRLSQQYQKLIGSMTVQYEGREQTLQQMARYLEVSDRAKREEAWRLSNDRRLREKEVLEDLYNQLLSIRVTQAENAGYPNYRDYAFRRKERFDYSPSDCEAFHRAVEQYVVPLARKFQEKRRQAMGLPTLKPWDLSCDPLGRAPLKPFHDSHQLSDGIHKILGQVDPVFGGIFSRMREIGLLDLDSRVGKAPGGYQTTLSEARLPFIFMNAVGLDGDVRTLLHEGGHALHSFLARDIAFSPYRGAPMEFCEVASMSMELLGAPHLDVFYKDPEDRRRSVLQHLENAVGLLPWIATVDAFQHWIYLNSLHTRDDRKAAWVGLRKRFGGAEDWRGLEDALAYQWHKQLHIFELPFYYIEYGIAQLGALQVWRNSRRNRPDAVAAYTRALKLGGSRTLPQLFEAAGIKFDFSEGTIRPLMEEVEAELERLANA